MSEPKYPTRKELLNAHTKIESISIPASELLAEARFRLEHCPDFTCYYDPRSSQMMCRKEGTWTDTRIRLQREGGLFTRSQSAYTTKTIDPGLEPFFLKLGECLQKEFE